MELGRLETFVFITEGAGRSCPHSGRRRGNVTVGLGLCVTVGNFWLMGLAVGKHGRGKRGREVERE